MITELPMHCSGLMQSIASTVHAVSGSAVSRGDRAPSESIRGTAFCPSAHWICSRWCGQCQLELEPPVKKMMRKCSLCAKGFQTQEDFNIHLMMRHKNQNRKNSDDSVCFDFNKSIDFIIKQTDFPEMALLFSHLSWMLFRNTGATVGKKNAKH